jgi:hypothetical protein
VKVNVNDREQMAEAGTDAGMQFGRYLTEVMEDAPAPAAEAYLYSVFSTLVGLSVAVIGRERTATMLYKMQLVAGETNPDSKRQQH